LFAVIAAIVSAQTLVEHAAAAAGGTAAAAAGKKVSEGIDSVFGKLGTITKDAAAPSDNKNKPRRGIDPAPPIPEVRLGAGTAATVPAVPGAKKAATPAVASKRTTDGSAGVAPASATEAAAAATDPAAAEAPAVPAAPAVPPTPQVTASDVAATVVGTTREDVTGKLGKPASRVTMDDDGKLVEIYTYRNAGGSLGSLRLVNGQVTEVRPLK
jgi:hypothetical protein